MVSGKGKEEIFLLAAVETVVFRILREGENMCQTSVVIDRKGEQEKIMENVTSLEMLADGVRIATLFEEPREISSVRLEKIDFMSGTVILVEQRGNDNE